MRKDEMIRKYEAGERTETSGEFREILNEYIGRFAALHDRRVKYVRKALHPFFRFLTERNVASIADVTTETLTEFLVWGERSGNLDAVHDILSLSAFFKWAIAEGHRSSGNPVIGFIHKAPRKHHIPRPLEKNDLDFMWQLLHERGNSRLRLAAAIAEESGLRTGEICLLRLADVDAESQRLFVASPDKAGGERWAFFGEKTKRFLVEWMAERKQECGHDYMLHNTRGKPMQHAALPNEFNRTLCKTYKGRTVNEVGFDKWSTHRLRDTMASNLVSVVMAAGGWKTVETTMVKYTRLP